MIMKKEFELNNRGEKNMKEKETTELQADAIRQGLTKNTSASNIDDQDTYDDKR